jgi:hypothetical protein
MRKFFTVRQKRNEEHLKYRSQFSIPPGDNTQDPEIISRDGNENTFEAKT